ncbi:MAG: glycosyltransferase family 2 protein [Chitinophagaceae bacterium]
MLKIIVPLAGSSDLFAASAGYMYPKPLIEINGKPMIELVMQNLLAINEPKQFIFIVKEEDCIKFHIDSVLKLLSPSCEVVRLKRNTKGALCSVLMSIDKINANDELLIVNGDQIVDVDFNAVLSKIKTQQAETAILTFNSIHPRWSYAIVEENNIIQTAEKHPISNNAIAGFYYFSNANEFIQNAYKTIMTDDSLDGVYFISPVINQYVLQNKKTHNVSIKASQYHSFYAPQMVKEFEKQIPA